MKLHDCKNWTCLFYGQVVDKPRYKKAPGRFQKYHRRNYKKIHSRNHLMYVRFRNDSEPHGLMHQLGYQILHNGRKP